MTAKQLESHPRFSLFVNETSINPFNKLTYYYPITCRDILVMFKIWNTNLFE